jgi:hypothetical protein
MSQQQQQQQQTVTAAVSQYDANGGDLVAASTTNGPITTTSSSVQQQQEPQRHQHQHHHHQVLPRTEGGSNTSTLCNIMSCIFIRKRLGLSRRLRVLMALALCVVVMLSFQTRLVIVLYKKTGAGIQGATDVAWQHLNFIPTVIMGEYDQSTTMRRELKGPALYSQTRMDRSGMIIVEMLNAHAYAYSIGRIYGGSCSGNRLPPHQPSAESLLQAMGLDTVLLFACPPTPRNSDTNETETAQGGGIVMKRDVYHSHVTHKVWKRDWISYIRSVASYPARNSDKSTTNSTNTSTTAAAADAYFVAVHIRRGDVSPCKHTGRYLPNSHFLELMDLYIPPEQDHRRKGNKKVKVTIFSETDSFEAWDDFLQQFHDKFKKYKFSSQYDVELALDGSLAETWRQMSMADLLILSRSTFSLVPAMLNRFGTVVYTKFPRSPLPDWKIAPQHVVDHSDRVVVAGMAADQVRCAAWYNRSLPTTPATATTTAGEANNNDGEQQRLSGINATNETTAVDKR